MFGLVTLPIGNRAAVWKKDGTYTLLDGPRRIPTYGRRVQLLQKFIAKPDQYLVIQRNNGEVEHVAGPVEVFLDPIVDAEISVRQATAIDANEALVVYQANNDDVERKIIRGPAMHFPQANEWVHDFSWHGSVGEENDKKIPSALTFRKLRVIPDQMYFRVDDVRTQDEALIHIKLMIFFELFDIGEMLDQTHDPVADFINAVTADIMDFTTDKTFETFKQHTNQLNELETYRQLLERAKRIGYRINKVVYRGYLANGRLQTMHDNAIETRTRLVLEAETEEQEQGLADLKLDRETAREMQLQEQLRAAAEHERDLIKIKHDEQLRQRTAENEAELHNKKALNDIEVEHQTTMNQQRLSYLEGMKAAGVDLTQVLVAENRNPDKLIRIDGDNTLQMHLHEN